MKSSRYNILVELPGGKKLAFNSVTAALAEIDAETLPRFERLLRAPELTESPADDELRQQMNYARFLCADSLDEVSEQEQRNSEQRQSQQAFFLTVAPTLACNFRCDYCFQSASPVMMGTRTVEALLRFCETRLAGSEHLMITWFGGEPTLCSKLIISVQQRLAALARRFDVKRISASIITNGFLLDATLAQQYKDAGIDEAQITIDGPPEIHNRRRKLAGGHGTFAKIIENLAEVSRILRIVVRINVDSDNADAALQVVEILRQQGLLPRVNIYFAPVNPAGGACSDVQGRCLSTQAFSKLQTRLDAELVDRGINRIEYPMIAPGGYCGAGHVNSYVVAPNGLLFKCWEELSLDPALSVGDIFGGERSPQQQRNFDRYEKWNPFTKSECRECRILPLCLGGCPKAATDAADTNHGYCSPWRYNLREMLVLRYLCNSQQEVNG